MGQRLHVQNLTYTDMFFSVCFMPISAYSDITMNGLIVILLPDTFMNSSPVQQYNNIIKGVKTKHYENFKKELKKLQNIDPNGQKLFLLPQYDTFTGNLKKKKLLPIKEQIDSIIQGHSPPNSVTKVFSTRGQVNKPL